MSASRTVYYITRSYPSLREHAGGSSLLRKNAVELFRKSGYKVVVVTPHFGSNELVVDEKNGVIKIPYKQNEKFRRILQRFGLAEDYLDKWAENSIEYLCSIVRSEDILFSTTGGELSTVKISSIVKSQKGCSSIINFRDPINYGNYSGLKRDSLFHVSREKNERKYLSNADYIITSCDTFRMELTRKYPEYKNRISNNYFGYIGEPLVTQIDQNERNSKIRIVYGGNFSTTQSPEQICEVVSNHEHRDKISLTLIGNYKNYKPVQKYLDVFKFIDKIPHNEYSSFIAQNSDVGFVPLKGEYYKYCFPSKIFEYLNHGLAILGSLPEGDALDFINRNEYGVAVKFNDKTMLNKAITELVSRDRLFNFRSKIVKENHQWSMNKQIAHTLDRLEAL